MLLINSILAFAATASAAEIIKVAVGQNGLTYTPNDITAVVGQQVQFSFFPKNHTVTQSSFSDPCHPLAAGGFFSDFVPTTSSPSLTTFTITVSDTKPIWIYCGQGSHCQTGMVAAINAPKSGNTLAAFQLLAKNASLSTSPFRGPQGGMLSLGNAISSNGTGTGSATGTGTAATTTPKTVTTDVTSAYTDATTTYTTVFPSTYTTADSSTGTTTNPTASPTFDPSNEAGSKVGSAGLVGLAAFGAAFALL